MDQLLAPRQAEATSLGVDSQKLGIWALLGSEVMFFSSLIVTYIIFRGKSVTGPFPQEALDVPLTACTCCWRELSVCGSSPPPCPNR